MKTHETIWTASLPLTGTCRAQDMKIDDLVMDISGKSLWLSGSCSENQSTPVIFMGNVCVYFVKICTYRHQIS